jgi:hypothetical protein
LVRVLAGAWRPECCGSMSLYNREGAGKAGYLLIPMARVQKKTHAAVTTGSAGYPGPPCAMALRLIRALPGDHAWLPPSPARRRKRLHELDACIGAPGPHDFAVRRSFIRRARNCACGCRVHRIPLPTSVTIAKRPSCGNGTATVLNLIWGHREAIYFRYDGWTGFRGCAVICPSGSHTTRHTREIRCGICQVISTSDDVSSNDTFNDGFALCES